YAIIGGIAMLQHTRVRTTDDVDALISLPQLAMPALFEELQARGFDMAVARNVREFRDEGMTTLRFGGVVVDLLRPILPLYEHVWNARWTHRSVNTWFASVPRRRSS